MAEVYNVQFLCRVDCFMPGEQAGVSKESAEWMIGKRYAKPVKELPVAQRGQDIPGRKTAQEQAAEYNAMLEPAAQPTVAAESAPEQSAGKDKDHAHKKAKRWQ